MSLDTERFPDAAHVAVEQRGGGGVEAAHAAERLRVLRVRTHLQVSHAALMELHDTCNNKMVMSRLKKVKVVQGHNEVKR